MASYVDNPSKLDWAMSFQRTGTFPIDRSSIFASKADATKYAKGDIGDPDERGLCGSSYVGQQITVYENGVVTCYVIAENRSLQPIGSATAGDEKSIHLEASPDGSGVLSLFGFSTATVGQQPRVKDKGDGQLEIEWFTPDTGTLEELTQKVTALETTVGNAGSGLVKDVNDLKTAVGTPAGPEGEPAATGLYAELEKKANKADTLAGYGITDAYTKTEVDGLVGSAFYYKGTYNSLDEMLESELGKNPKVGWTYNIVTAGGFDAKGVAIKAGDNIACSGVDAAFTPVQYVLTQAISAGYQKVAKTAITEGEAIRVGDKVQDNTPETPNYGTVVGIDADNIYVKYDGTVAPELTEGTLYTWDVLAGTVDLSNYYTKNEVDQKIEEVKGDETALEGRVSKLEGTVGNEESGLVKDVADNKKAIGDINTTLGTEDGPGLVKDVADNKKAIETLNGDDNTPGSVKKIVADSAKTLQDKMDQITAEGTGTIDTRIDTHNKDNNAHTTLFAAKQNKIIRQDVTVQPSQFMESTTYPDLNKDDEYTYTVEVSSISGIAPEKDYVANVAVIRGSEDEAVSAGFSPSVAFTAGKLYLFARDIPTGNIELSVTLTEIQA